MESIKGYKYLTEQEAQDAVALCNTYYGIPSSPTSVTTTWTVYYYSSGPDTPFWFILHDDSLPAVLGPSSEFEIDFTN